ncbi:MAG TPA: hypothetical protein VF376_00875 [Thermoanaerobaculia bacterium]
MTKGKRPATRTKDLAAKNLTPKHAKNVRGGIGMLLPAVQKVREAAIGPGPQACDAGSKDPA